MAISPIRASKLAANFEAALDLVGTPDRPLRILFFCETGRDVTTAEHIAEKLGQKISCRFSGAVFGLGNFGLRPSLDAEVTIPDKPSFQHEHQDWFHRFRVAFAALLPSVAKLEQRLTGPLQGFDEWLEHHLRSRGEIWLVARGLTS